jgi:hypothetical protein
MFVCAKIYLVSFSILYKGLKWISDGCLLRHWIKVFLFGSLTLIVMVWNVVADVWSYIMIYCLDLWKGSCIRGFSSVKVPYDCLTSHLCRRVNRYYERIPERSGYVAVWQAVPTSILRHQKSSCRMKFHPITRRNPHVASGFFYCFALQFPVMVLAGGIPIPLLTTNKQCWTSKRIRLSSSLLSSVMTTYLLAYEVLNPQPLRTDIRPLTNMIIYLTCI